MWEFINTAGHLFPWRSLPVRRIQPSMFCLHQPSRFPASYFWSTASLEFFGSSVRTRERPVASKTVSDAISKECLRRQAGRKAGGPAGEKKRNPIKLGGRSKYRNIQVLLLAALVSGRGCLFACHVSRRSDRISAAPTSPLLLGWECQTDSPKAAGSRCVLSFPGTSLMDQRRSESCS